MRHLLPCRLMSWLSGIDHCWIMTAVLICGSPILIGSCCLLGWRCCPLAGPVDQLQCACKMSRLIGTFELNFPIIY